jgi:hypothetical protein
MQREGRSDIGGAVVAVLLIVFGGLALQNTTTYTDVDSAVFPRAIAIALIVISIVFLIRWLRYRAIASPAHEKGSWVRRAAFVCVMLATALAMPWVGFIAAALVSFAALMVVAMFDRWTPARALWYGAVGLGVVFGFYTLFAKILLVPLPDGWLFQG